MKRVLAVLLCLLLLPQSGYSTTYYASNTGTGSTCSLASPGTVVACLAILVADDILILKKGTGTTTAPAVYTGDAYMMHPPTNLSGTAGHYITVQAETDGTVVIDGQVARQPVLWDHNDYWIVQGMNVDNSSDDVMSIFPGSDNNIFRRICAWNANPARNTHVWNFWQTTGNLIEDTCAFGSGRKMYEPFETSGLTIRRPFAQWSRQDVDFGPYITYSLSYDSDHIIIENPIGTRDEDTPSAGISDQGIFSMDRLDEYTDCQIASGYFGGLAYLLGSQNVGPDNHGGELHGGQVFGDLQFTDTTLYIEPGTHTTLVPVLMAGYNGNGGMCAPNSPTATRKLASVSVIGTPGAGNPSMIDTSTPNNGWNQTNYKTATSVSGIYGAQNIFVNDGTKGATMCYQYINGTLTANPLWPGSIWPMNQRIIDAMTYAGRTPINVTTTVTNIFGPIPAACGGTVTANPQETFASYTPGTNISGGVGGSGWLSGWVESLSEPITAETAPTGLTGQAAKSTDPGGTFAGYYRQYATPETAGFMDAILRSSITNPNDVMRFELGDLSSTRMRLAFTSGNLSAWDDSTSSYVTLTPIVANANFQVHIEYDSSVHPSQYRAQVNHGTFTSWLGTIGSFTGGIETVGINDHATNTHDYWVAQLNAQSEITLSPTSASQGATQAITITGTGSSFANGVSACSFNPSTLITVVSTVVSSPTLATCNITIGSSATTGLRDVYMTTGDEVEVYVGGFNITAATPPTPPPTLVRVRSRVRIN